MVKPPDCVICGKKMDEINGGNVIWFKKSQSDLNWDKWQEENDFPEDHPPYGQIFCSKHVKAAEELSHLTYGEALGILKEKYTVNSKKSLDLDDEI